MRELLPWQQQGLPLSYCQPLLISCGTLTVTHKYSGLYLLHNIRVYVQAAAAPSPRHAGRRGHRRARQRL